MSSASRLWTRQEIAGLFFRNWLSFSGAVGAMRGEGGLTEEEFKSAVGGKLAARAA
jgi:hypothetical protein